MVKFFRLCLLLLLFVFVLTGCSMSDKELVGYWLSTEGDVLHILNKSELCISEFNSDENVTFCTYSLLGKDKISYRIGDTVYVYKFVVDKSNRTLTLYEGDSEKESIVRVYHGSEYMKEEIAVGLAISRSK